MSPQYIAFVLIINFYFFTLNRSQLVTCDGDCAANNVCSDHGRCNFSCAVWAACVNGDISCGFNSTCNVYCGLAASCEDLNIYGETSNKVTLTADKNAAATNVRLWCPDNGHGGEPSCFVYASTDLLVFSQYEDLTIYAVEGFYDVVIINCNSLRCGDITLSGCGGSLLAGWCTVDTDTYDQCGTWSPKTCETYLHPTNTPTLQPTLAPTMPKQKEIILELWVNTTNMSAIIIDDILKTIEKSVDEYLNNTLNVTYAIEVQLISLINNTLTVSVIIYSDDDLSSIVDDDTLIAHTENELISEYGDQIIIGLTTTEFLIEITAQKPSTESNISVIIIVVLLLLLLMLFAVLFFYYYKKRKFNKEMAKIPELGETSPDGTTTGTTKTLQIDEPGAPIGSHGSVDVDEINVNNVVDGSKHTSNLDENEKLNKHSNIKAGIKNVIMDDAEEGSDSDALYVDRNGEDTAYRVADARSDASIPVSQITLSASNNDKYLDRASIDDLYKRVSVHSAVSATPTTATEKTNDNETVYNENTEAGEL